MPSAAAAAELICDVKQQGEQRFLRFSDAKARRFRAVSQVDLNGMVLMSAYLLGFFWAVCNAEQGYLTVVSRSALCLRTALPFPDVRLAHWVADTVHVTKVTCPVSAVRPIRGIIRITRCMTPVDAGTGVAALQGCTGKGGTGCNAKRLICEHGRRVTDSLRGRRVDHLTARSSFEAFRRCLHHH